MSMRSRGQETTVSVSTETDGLLGGSFAKVNRWSMKPRAELVESEFVGEDTSDLDQRHDGWDFDFELDELDPKPLQVYLTIAAALESGTRPPAVQLQFITRYRDPAQPSSTATCSGELVLKLDERSVGGRKEYVKCKFSGKCKTITLT